MSNNSALALLARLANPPLSVKEIHKPYVESPASIEIGARFLIKYAKREMDFYTYRTIINYFGICNYILPASRPFHSTLLTNLIPLCKSTSDVSKIIFALEHLSESVANKCLQILTQELNNSHTVLS